MGDGIWALFAHRESCASHQIYIIILKLEDLSDNLNEITGWIGLFIPYSQHKSGRHLKL